MYIALDVFFKIANKQIYENMFPSSIWQYRKTCGDGVRPLQEKPRMMKASGDGFVPAGQDQVEKIKIILNLVISIIYYIS